MSAPRAVRLAAAAALAAALLASCSVIQQGADVLSGGAETVSRVEKSPAVKVASQLRSTFSDISEEEEYYIGRSVAALILARYPAAAAPEFDRYLNVLGTTLAYASSRPEIFAGYHFLLLDTDEVNAMAAPGGFVFVTRGLVRRCKDEEAFAGVLAHEIGHVAARHGLQSIKKSRLVDAFKLIGTEAAKKYGPAELSQLTEIFEGALGDIMETVVERGYDRKYEYEADAEAVDFAVRAGYSPKGLQEFLGALAAGETKGGGKGWYKTHPAASDRLSRVTQRISGLSGVPAPAPVRTQRFRQALKGVR